MNWKFWKKKDQDEVEIKNVRQIEDIKISVSDARLMREVRVSAWNEKMTRALFWEVWDGLREREK